MTKEEYIKRVEEIDDKARGAQRRLACDFVMANKEFKVGDIITDLDVIIEVSEINWSFGWYEGDPYAIYVGARLKKDLSPYKSAEDARIHGCHKLTKLERKK